MRVVTLLVLLAAASCHCRRSSLREQVAVLRREQWRDRERIRELEEERRMRRDAGDEEGMLMEVLEQLSREIVGLAAEAERWRGVEERISRLEGRMESTRHLSLQGREAQILTTEETSSNEKKALNSWEGEGSGDLVDEDLFPAVTTKPIHQVPNEVQVKIEKYLEKHRKENLRYIKHIESNLNNKVTNLTKHLEKIERQTEIVQDTCAGLVENTTEDVRSSMALMDTLQDDLSNLWKRVSKVEFNSAQFQSSLDVLTHDWTEDRKDIRNLQTRLISTQKEAHAQSNRILAVEMLTTNLTLQRCRGDSEISKRHLQVENVELRLNQMSHRMDELLKQADSRRKLDENVFRNYREALTTIARRTENVSRELALLDSEQEIVRQDLNKFVQQLPKGCTSLTRNGVTLIHVPTLGPVEVYCDNEPEGGPWLVIQRRYNGTENFFRNWSDYTTGFGDLTSEFWLGNEAIHLLTEATRTKLHVDMWDIHDRYFHVNYGNFKVKSEMEQYALEVSNHTGNASDALKHHLGMGFSTFDRDNDASSANCAMHHSGGWWYQHCHRTDLNGRYSYGMTWYDEFSKDWLQLRRVEIKIATVESYS